MPRNEDQRKELHKILSYMDDNRDAFIDMEGVEKGLPFYDEKHLYAKEWYKFLPSARSPLFPHFMYSSVELAADVCEDKQVQLTVGSIDTACADKDKMEIIIAPHTLLKGAVKSRGFTLRDETAIMVAATNGMIIHEAAHLLKSMTDLEAARARMYSGKTSPRIAGPTLSGFINTCEDIYIEWWLKETYPGLAPFVEAAHEFWFHEVDLGRRLHQLWMSRGIEEETYSVLPFLDVLIAMKNWRFAGSTVWKGIIAEYNDEIKCFRGLDDLSPRLEKIRVIWKKLCDDPRLRWSTESEKGRGSGTSCDARGTFAGSKATELAQIEEKEAHRERETMIVIDEINKKLSRRNLTIRIKKRQTDISKIPPMIVKVVEPTHSRVEPDKRFISLAKRLRAALTRNYAPGQPTRRGPKLVSTRLQRIVTDGKIFTYPEVRKRTGRDFEIVILIDCSGSMAGGNPTKIREAIEVGVATYLSLKSARIRTVLLGHTSLRSSGISTEEEPIVYVFGEAKDTVDRVVRRAYKAFEGNFKFNNYDGLAIEKACTFFSDKPTKRWLLVVSDGQPAGIHYGGDEAIEHSRLAVNAARKIGVDVVSITIEDGAYAVNDRIYGKAKNIHTSSSKALMDLVEAMFVKHKGDRNGET